MQIDELIEWLDCDCNAQVCTFREAAQALRDLKASADALAGALRPFGYEWDRNEYLAEAHWSEFRHAAQALAAYREKFDHE